MISFRALVPILTIFLMLILKLSGGVGTAGAQIIQSPVNVALGGGGTANTTGYEALFINPANLFIQEKEYRFQVSAGNSGFFFSSPLNRPDLSDFFDTFDQQVHFYSGSPYHLDQIARDQLISRNYGTADLLSEHHTRGEIHWLGMHWSRLDKSFAFSARTRLGNRYVVGRGYYDQSPVETPDAFELDRSLIHQYQTLHELSFGYAESFDFVNGLIPGLGQLIIGIAPKFVIGGPYLDTEYMDKYQSDHDSNLLFNRVHSYNHLSTGIFSEAGKRLQWGEPPFHSEANRNDLFSPTGFGAGLDFGLTYLITLGDDLSVIRGETSGTRKSLRFSFAITDVGFISYNDNPREFSSEADTILTGPLPESSETLFLGHPGEQYHFLGENGTHPLLDAENRSDDNFSVMMPTAVHSGILFQINRIKLMGDLSLGFTNNAFNTTRLTSYIGAELRPFSFLPVRGGMRVASNLTDYYSFGAGLETRYFDLNLAVQLRGRSTGPTNEITGVSLAALKFYIP